MTNPKRVEVSGCHDCSWAREATWCMHPLAYSDYEPSGASFAGDEPPPADCPLRKGPVLVALKGVE